MPRSQGTTMQELQFTLVKTPNNKYHAMCQICDRQLCNTAAARLQAHRNRCRLNSNGIVEYVPMPKVIKPKTENRDSNTPDKAESSNRDKEINNYYTDIEEKVVDEEEVGVNLQIVDFENTTTKDECIAFGHYVSTQLKKMDSRTCAIVKFKISEMLFNAEIGNIQETD